MEKKDKIAMLEQSLDRKLTTLEMYENRPRKWILYLVIAMSIPCVCAAMPMMVIIQLPSAVATRSVGEKASPLPWLSVGASVRIFVPDWTWVASVRRPPR